MGLVALYVPYLNARKKGVKINPNDCIDVYIPAFPQAWLFTIPPKVCAQSELTSMSTRCDNQNTVMWVTPAVRASQPIHTSVEDIQCVLNVKY